MRLREEELQCVQVNMLNLTRTFQRHYFGDLVLDFYKLMRMNDNGFRDNEKLIFIARTCGCELGYRDDDRIAYFMDNLNREGYKNEELAIYEIDLVGLNECQDEIYYCTDLIKNLEEKYNFFKRILEDKTNPLKY